jgi:hypothetical protein
MQTDKPDQILSISLNQDKTCFTVAAENGFGVYQISPFKENFFRPMDGGIGHAEMLY